MADASDLSVFSALLVSPFKLVRILRQYSDPVINTPDHPLAWFTSEEGAAAYRNADTVLKKTLYFNEYLTAIAKRNESKLSFITLYRLAFLIAHRVAGSSLPYGRYPDILDKGRNPFVSALEIADTDKYPDLLTGLILSLMHTEKDIDNWVNDYLEPYKNLTQLEEDRSNLDQYLLERETIFVLNQSTKDLFHIGPYAYDILPHYEEDEESDEEGENHDE